MSIGRQLHTGLICGLLLAIIPATLASAAEDANDLKTEMDKVSYIIGTQFAGNLLKQGIEVNLEMLFRGIREALAGQPCTMSLDEQQTIMTAWQQKHIAKLKAKQEKAVVEKLGEENAWKVKLEKPELMTFDPNEDYFWILETNKGTIRIKMMPDVAPMHVTSTIFLTNKGFYDNTIFHRVIPGFVAQGGDPLGTGTGGPGYKYEGEFSATVKHDRAFLLSMANAGPDTDGSQFFITYRPLPHLDGKHTVFGEVVEGQDVAKKLEAAGTQEGKPTETLTITKARIEKKPKG